MPLNWVSCDVMVWVGLARTNRAREWVGAAHITRWRWRTIEIGSRPESHTPFSTHFAICERRPTLRGYVCVILAIAIHEHYQLLFASHVMHCAHYSQDVHGFLIKIVEHSLLGWAGLRHR